MYDVYSLVSRYHVWHFLVFINNVKTFTLYKTLYSIPSEDKILFLVCESMKAYGVLHSETREINEISP